MFTQELVFRIWYVFSLIINCIYLVLKLNLFGLELRFYLTKVNLLVTRRIVKNRTLAETRTCAGAHFSIRVTGGKR